MGIVGLQDLLQSLYDTKAESRLPAVDSKGSQHVLSVRAQP